MPRDKRQSSRSRSRSPKQRFHEQAADRRARDKHQSLRSRSSSPKQRFHDQDIDRRPPHEPKRPSRSGRSRSRSGSRGRGDRRSTSPSRKRHRRYSTSPSRSRSHSRTEEIRRPRSRSRSLSRERKEKRRRHRSPSLSSSSGEDGPSRKKEKRKDKDSKRSKSKERRKERKRDKKERKEKKRRDKNKGNVPHWGKYGIITEIDIFTKNQEFHTWLVEERKINPETISKDQERKEFARFVEDYNTATLPHEKYYNMEAHERRMSALRQGEYLPPADDTYDFQADMKALSGAHKKKSAEQDSYMSKEQLMELRRVQQERSEVGRMKLLGMDVKQNFGVRMDGTMFDG